MQNNLSETYALLHYMMPSIFDADCGGAFAACFSLNTGWGSKSAAAGTTAAASIGASTASAGASAGSDAGTGTEAEGGAKVAKVQIDRQALNAAHYMLRPFVLRRVKTEVEQKLPPKLETMIKCPLSDMQRFWIKALLLRESKALTGHFAAQNEDSANKEGIYVVPTLSNDDNAR